LLFPYRTSNTCDGKIINCHFPLHQQPCILTQQHTLYLRAKLNKITITSIVVTTQYWNRKQWNTNLIIGTTHFNTHKTTKTQFQTSCFNFLGLKQGYVLHMFICLFLQGLAPHYWLRRSWAQWTITIVTIVTTIIILKGNWINTHNIVVMTKYSVATSVKHSTIIKNVDKGEECRYLIGF
jgi:hypothetical protein